MTKQQKIDLYKVYREGLERDFPVLTKALNELGLQESEIDAKIAQAISTLKGEELPEDSDTLKELADKIVAQAVADTTLAERITVLENTPAVSGLGNLTTDEIVAKFSLEEEE